MNSLTFIYNVLKELSVNSSMLKKKEILKNNSSNIELMNFFYFCVGPKKYGIKKFSKIEPALESTLSWPQIESLLNILTNREATGKKAIALVEEYMSKATIEEQFIIECLLLKKTRCGVSVALINETWNDLIPAEIKLEKAYAYSEKDMKHIVYPAISQRKCDGARCLAMRINGKVTLYSSSGKTYNNLTNLINEISKINTSEDFVLDGELLSVEVNNGIETVLPRKTGNGILTKAIKNTISEKEADTIRMVVWDYIPYEDYCNDLATKSYLETFMYLQDYISDCKYISVVESKFVQDKKEAKAHFKEMLLRGEEGIILKSSDLVWTGERSHKCIKFKLVIENSLKVVELIEGKEKYEGKLGALVCQSADGLVSVNVGSGLSDDDRERFWSDPNKILGHIVEIKSNGLIKAEDGTYSLFLPRYSGDRNFEKSEADDFKTIEALSIGSELLDE